MSDVSDAAAHGRQERDVREAAYNLSAALREACDGHRGWAMPQAAILELVNDYLTDVDVPFQLVRRFK